MKNPVPLQAGLERLCRYAVDAAKDGFEVLILSDRAIDSGSCTDSIPACSGRRSSSLNQEGIARTGRHYR